jgi:hypothetical protein
MEKQLDVGQKVRNLFLGIPEKEVLRVAKCPWSGEFRREASLTFFVRSIAL